MIVRLRWVIICKCLVSDLWGWQVSEFVAAHPSRKDKDAVPRGRPDGAPGTRQPQVPVRRDKEQMQAHSTPLKCASLRMTDHY
jgi:hypothetical protein